MITKTCGKVQNFFGFDREDSSILIIEQHQTLAKQVPPLYLVIFLTGFGLVASSTSTTAPDWLAIYIPVFLMAVCLFRLYYWVSYRNLFSTFSLQRRKRDLRGITIISPLIGLSYTALAITLFQFGEANQKQEVVFLILITSYVAAYCLSCLP